MLDVHWTLTVSVPQLDAIQQTLLELGVNIVAEIAGIQQAINSLVTNQADGQEALSAHLTAIENEIRQLGANPTQAELDHLADQVNAAAATTTKAAADLRAMTTQVEGMVPDTPPPA
jgi:hypothetical protein